MLLTELNGKQRIISGTCRERRMSVRQDKRLGLLRAACYLESFTSEVLTCLSPTFFFNVSSTHFC
jgi:hypothetical protein